MDRNQIKWLSTMISLWFILPKIYRLHLAAWQGNCNNILIWSPFKLLYLSNMSHFLNDHARMHVKDHVSWLIDAFHYHQGALWVFLKKAWPGPIFQDFCPPVSYDIQSLQYLPCGVMVHTQDQWIAVHLKYNHRQMAGEVSKKESEFKYGLFVFVTPN